MKRTVLLLMSIALILLSTQSCKKDKLQPTWQWLHKPYLILSDVEKVHQDNLRHIDAGRTTVGDYQWGDSTISLTSPAGYSVLSKMAAKELTKAYENAILPDTTKLTESGVIPEVIKKYLENRRDEDSEDAFDDLRLGISNDLYEMNPFLGEQVLWAFKYYLEGDIGGSSDWYSGTRSLEKELAIRKLMISQDWDFKDPWECNGKPEMYNEFWYLDYSEGDIKSVQVNTKNLSVEEIRLLCAKTRFELSGQIGERDEYKTKYDEKDGVYYIILK